MEQLQAVLFDFGGVFTGTPLKAFRERAVDFGITTQQMTDLVLGPTEVDGQHPWHRLERGEMEASEVRTAIGRIAKDTYDIELDPWKILMTTGRSPEDREIMIERVRALRATGMKTAIVTNNFKEAGNHWRKLLPLDELFHTVVDSSEVGVRKPDPRIYELTAGRLGVDPAHCAFLDDLAANVAGAVAVGMTGVLVEEDKTSAIAWLDELVALRT